MPKNLDDTKAFESQWKNRGRDVRILDFSPDVILADLHGPFSANELRNIAFFLDECEDQPEVDQKGVYIDE
jgi:hypothetical protein